jgi:hypothetical protein
MEFQRPTKPERNRHQRMRHEVVEKGPPETLFIVSAGLIGIGPHVIPS